MDKRDWHNLYKVRIANPDVSMRKHEIVKLLIVVNLLEKYKRIKHLQNIYTESPVGEKRRCDVFHQNIKSKEVYIYEIQKGLTKNWERKTIEYYKDFEVPFMKSTTLVIIPIDDLSDDIIELDKEIREIVR